MITFLNYAMTEILGMTYDEIKRLGKPKLVKDVESREERQEKRNKIIRHFITDYYLDKQLEIDGKVIQASMDESYIGDLQQSDFSLMETSARRIPVPGMEAAVRSSTRICIIGAVTRNGMISTHEAVNDQPEIIPDCAFFKSVRGKGLKEVAASEPGGSFKELDNEGNDRSTSASTDDIDVQKDGLKRLQAFCIKNEIDTLKHIQGSSKPKSKTAPELRQEIKAKFHHLDNDGKSIQQTRVQQILNFDYDKMRNKYSNLAKTSLKFFIANQAIGDYHDNMDTDTFFKVSITTNILLLLFFFIFFFYFFAK